MISQISVPSFYCTAQMYHDLSPGLRNGKLKCNLFSSFLDHVLRINDVAVISTELVLLLAYVGVLKPFYILLT